MTQEFASWTIGNKKVKAIQINNKEVQSIEANNVVIWQKEPEIDYDYIELEFTGQTLSQYTSNTLIGSDILIDYGDGNIVAYEGDYSHTYTTGGNYRIKIYGVTSLGNSCFSGCTGLTSITIPDSVTSLGATCFDHCTGLTSITISNSVTSLGTSCFNYCTDLTSVTIPNNVTSLGTTCFNHCTSLTSVTIPNSVTSLGNYCFKDCTNLTHIYLNWTSTDIPTYNNTWITDAYIYLIFNIPSSTTSLYTAKGYPSEKLEEEIIYDEIELTTNKSILSYADNETCTLTAQLTYNNNPVNISGETIEFFNGLTSMGTAQTNSSGVATKTYTSTGAGDLSFTAEVGSLVSETYSIEDCYYWNEQGVTYTSNSSTDRKVLTGLEDIVSFTPNGAFEFSFTLEDSTGSSKRLYLISKPQSTSTTNYYGIGANIGPSNNHMVIRTTSTTITETAGKTNPADFKFIRNGTTLQMYHNDTLVTTKTVNWFDTYAPYTISWAIWSTGTITATNIKIKPFESINLVASQSILSYADGDTATLTATHSLGTGQTVNLYNASDDSLIGAMTDNEDGTYSYTYNANGSGDLTVYASDGNMTSEDMLIEDCIYYSASETICTTSNNYITIADLSSMTLPSVFQLSMDYKTNYEARCGLFNKTTFANNPYYSVFIGSPSTTGSTWYYGYRTTSTSTTDISASATDYHTYLITRNDNSIYYKRDTENASSKSVNWFDSYHYVIGIMTWGGTSYVKNIKLKAL